MAKIERASVRAVCVFLSLCVCYVSTFFILPKHRSVCVRVRVCAEVLCCVVRNSQRSINGSKTYDILRERRWRGHHVRICFGWLPFFRLPHVRHCCSVLAAVRLLLLLLLLRSLKFSSLFGVCERGRVNECCPSRGAAFASAVAPYTSTSGSLSICTCVYLNFIYPIWMYILCSIPSIYYSTIYVCEFIYAGLMCLTDDDDDSAAMTLVAVYIQGIENGATHSIHTPNLSNSHF